jgi:UDP-N-acetylglucosamine 4,6-dehydratase
MKILITGGTGSLGTALVNHWHTQRELRIFSRNPHKQSDLAKQFGLSSDNFVLGDICDEALLRRACIGCDVLIHAAALKVVADGERNPEEYMRVNAIGSQVVARAWADVNPGNSKAILINSDKAVAPINHYGVTKAMAEAIFISHGFSSLRYGNVVASEGSFIHKWNALIRRGKPIELRYPYPTRFFVPFELAIQLIEDVLVQAEPGVFVPHNLETFSLYSLGTYLTKNRIESDLEPGEKQHEILVSDGEKAYRVTDNIARVFKETVNTKGYPAMEWNLFVSDSEHLMNSADLIARLAEE